MRLSKILTLSIMLVLTVELLAQQAEHNSGKLHETNLPDKLPASLSNVFRSNDPNGFIVQIFPHRNRNTPKINWEEVPDVTNIKLNSSIIWLSSGIESNCRSSTLVEVETEVIKGNVEKFEYNYSVTAGKTIGKGRTLLWDLTNVKPGIYTITAAVDDGCGFCGKTQTKTVEVKGCPNVK